MISFFLAPLTLCRSGSVWSDANKLRLLMNSTSY